MPVQTTMSSINFCAPNTVAINLALQITQVQVKVNGHRMELGEIESTLQKHDCVQRAIVLARTDIPGLEEVKTLVAYVQPTDTAASHTELEKFLNDQLPHYMVPRMYMSIKEWPLNTSNKVMKQSLPLPEVSDPQRVHGLLRCVIYCRKRKMKMKERTTSVQ